MFSQTNEIKSLFTRLEKATAATQKKDLDEGKPQNPLSAVHWTMENHAGGYKITMMRNGLVIGQKSFEAKDMKDQESVTAIVQAMFEKIADKKAA
jgi:hypothetical protein